ncbi:MAG: sulfur carrier protein ThiS [Thermoanaerobaculia bacterium]
MKEARTVQVNGERREVALGSTVADVIASLHRDPRPVAVELNGSIVPRERYDHVSLQEGDRLEIVQFVQGG